MAELNLEKLGGLDYEKARQQENTEEAIERATRRAGERWRVTATHRVGGEKVRAQEWDLVLMDPTSGAQTVTLPKAKRANIGVEVAVKNDSTSANNITIVGSDGQSVDGSSSLVLAASRAGRVFVSQGGGGWISIASV